VEALCQRVIVIARGRLVAAGTPAELAARLGRRRRVIVRVDGRTDAVVPVLEALPGVAAVVTTNGGFRLELDAGDDACRQVGEAMQRSGFTVRELREETPDLEEIFLGLVDGGPHA
jgi:ABC-2 type transport system ATP-binding protein